MNPENNIQENDRSISNIELRDVELSSEAIDVAEKFLKSAKEFYQLERDLYKLIPANCHYWFRGKEDVLVIGRE